MRKELRILSADEYGMLLYHIDQLPYAEAKLLEAELKETYRHCLDKWGELETLVTKITNKKISKSSKVYRSPDRNIDRS